MQIGRNWFHNSVVIPSDTFIVWNSFLEETNNVELNEEIHRFVSLQNEKFFNLIETVKKFRHSLPFALMKGNERKYKIRLLADNHRNASTLRFPVDKCTCKTFISSSIATTLKCTTWNMQETKVLFSVCTSIFSSIRLKRKFVVSFILDVIYSLLCFILLHSWCYVYFSLKIFESFLIGFQLEIHDNVVIKETKSV